MPPESATGVFVSHGLTRLSGYVSTLESGWVDGAAVPDVIDAAPGLVVTNANNGFAQIALAKSRPLLIEKARKQGIAAVAIRNSAFCALWPDVEPLAEEQLIALTTINTRSYMIICGWRGKNSRHQPDGVCLSAPRKSTGHLGPGIKSDVAWGSLLASKRKVRISPELQSTPMETQQLILMKC